VVTSARTVHAARVILTTGGQSYPGCGTTGDGYRFAAALGHTIVPPRPALVPITTDAPWVREQSGVTLPDVVLRVVEPDVEGGKPRVLAERRGSLLFTHFGLSGPVALDVSRAVSGHPEPRSLAVICDLLPAVKPQTLDDALRTQGAAAGKRQLVSLLPEQVPKRLSETLLALAGVSPEQKAAELSARARRQIVETLKQLSIPVSGTCGFKKAEVTAGGVALDEVDSRTMQSKVAANLYLAGEVLDLDGPIGGYNFQAAWSTGYLAGQSV
jgi:predicted Rossmann fold flavoprotein